MMSEAVGAIKQANTERDSAYIEQFKSLNPAEFKEWLEGNLSKVRSWPEGVQALVRGKWDSTQGGEMYPLVS
jgi:hypothetical protein